MFLFLSVNILVVVTLSLALNLLGIQPYLDARGVDYQALALFCLVWGMGGAFISLAVSRVTAKMMMGVKVIDPALAQGEMGDLVRTVHRLAAAAGIDRMPEVGYYESPEVNAFATGPTRNRALVAVSTGLLERMDRAQVEGVLAHEVAHVANGDMVTMTLVQGVINAVVMFVARVAAFFISQRFREESRRMANLITVLVLEIALSLLGAMAASWFSRRREFRADAGGAALAGRESMLSALKALKRNSELAELESQPSLAALKISGRGGFMALLSTHPPLEDRIAALMRQEN
ncbi:MAG: heat shock protein HtpX [Elusimicrobia bacterium]|nr:MAG: heat shock protein HtpX [Elusimicrobiota bacterium]